MTVKDAVDDKAVVIFPLITISDPWANLSKQQKGFLSLYWIKSNLKLRPLSQFAKMWWQQKGFLSLALESLRSLVKSTRTSCTYIFWLILIVQTNTKKNLKRWIGQSTLNWFVVLNQQMVLHILSLWWILTNKMGCLIMTAGGLSVFYQMYEYILVFYDCFN